MTTTKAPGRLQLGSPRAWSVVLGSLALLSFAAMIPLCLPSGQLPNAVIAAVIGVPCAAVGFSSPPPWRWPALLPPIRSALTAPAA